MEIGKKCLSKPLCVYVCSIIIHIISEWHAEARGGIVTAEKRKNWVGYLHPLYLKTGLSHYFLTQPHTISNCNIYINLNMLMKQNFKIFEE